jgi:hypothetical protein
VKRPFKAKKPKAPGTGKRAQRKGRLGKLLRVKPHCYAGPVVGACSGGPSAEHPLSRTLRKGRTLRMEISYPPDGSGAASPPQVLPPIHIDQFAAHVLCEGHNRALSVVDSEAERLQQALREARERIEAPVARPEAVALVDGHKFARWLCKYAAGWLAATGKRINPDIIRHAFGEMTNKPLYFLFPVRQGATVRFDDRQNLPLQTTEQDGGGGEQAHIITFEGLEFVVSTLPPDAPEMALIVADWPKGTYFMDRPRELNLQADRLRIRFDWSADPDETGLLDVTGAPIRRR